MQALKSRPGLRRGGIVYLRAEDIVPSPMQPRRNFEDESLRQLSESIRSYGILNPLTVRLRSGRYELVAGERRLRAAKLAGLRELPCILLDVNMEDAGLIALVENLQRKDLDFIEEAQGISRLIRMFSMSQEEAARRIGKSQSAVANKLRLLKLPQDLLETLRDRGLSERHARELLRVSGTQARLAVIEEISDRRLSVTQTEKYIDAYLENGRPPVSDKLRRRDARLFLERVARDTAGLRRSGMAAEFQCREEPEAFLLTVRIEK